MIKSLRDFTGFETRNGSNHGEMENTMFLKNQKHDIFHFSEKSKKVVKFSETSYVEIGKKMTKNSGFSRPVFFAGKSVFFMVFFDPFFDFPI